MTVRHSGVLLFQGKVTDKFLIVEKFNGMTNSDAKVFFKGLRNGVIETCKCIEIGLENAKVGDTVEILARYRYEEHHCKAINTYLCLYKIRKPKCKYGLKSIGFTLKLSDDIEVEDE